MLFIESDLNKFWATISWTACKNIVRTVLAISQYLRVLLACQVMVFFFLLMKPVAGNPNNHYSVSESTQA